LGHGLAGVAQKVWPGMNSTGGTVCGFLRKGEAGMVGPKLVRQGEARHFGKGEAGAARNGAGSHVEVHGVGTGKAGMDRLGMQRIAGDGGEWQASRE